MNLFTVVRFPNAVCSGNNGYNGTCYSDEECESKGGSSGGSCGGGYGVCCTCKKQSGKWWIDSQFYFNLFIPILEMIFLSNIKINTIGHHYNFNNALKILWL